MARRILRVRDPAAMAKIAERLVRRRDVAWRMLPKDLRRLQPILSRLMHRQIAAIDERTARRMARLAVRVGWDLGPDLAAATLTSEALDLQGVATGWVVERAERFPRRAEDRYLLVDGELVLASEAVRTAPIDGYAAMWDTPGVAPLQGIEAYRWIEREALLERVWRDPELRRLFREFTVWAKRRGFEMARIRLAWYTVVEPLLEHAESGFVERSWTELTPTELRAFMRAGLTRERILLKRDHTLQRIESAVDGSLDGKPRLGI